MSNNLDDLELRSDEVKEILTRPPSWLIQRGNILFFALLLLLICLTWVVKYPDIIKSEAIITTQIPPQKVYSRVSGKIDTLYVDENQKVSKGSFLGVIENSANSQDVLFLKPILDTINLKDGLFQFPIDSLPILFLGEIEPSFAEFENNYIEYLLNRNLQPYSNEVLANKISLTELKRRLSGLNEQYLINEEEIKFKVNGLERNRKLLSKGVISQQEFENKKSETLLAVRNFKNLGQTISETREAIGEAARISKGTEYNRTRAEIQLLKKTLQSFNQLKKSLKDWENTFALISNTSGKVSFLKYWNENQTVIEGDHVFTVIPNNNSGFVAKLEAPVQNSGKIKLGQKVNIKLRNYPDYEFGALVGRVDKISLAPNLEGFYLIDVSLPQNLITSYNKEILFKQEMQGTAEIITEDLRLIYRIFYQFKEVFSR